jgi:hypothetical protein
MSAEFCHCDELTLENLLCKSLSQCHSGVLTWSSLTSNSATSTDHCFCVCDVLEQVFAVNADLAGFQTLKVHLWTSCTNALYQCTRS